MSLPTVQPGDIVLCYRKPYEGPFKFLITRLILFFSTEWWKGEKTSKVYHAEMVYRQISDAQFQVITMEPPMCRFKDRSFNRKLIFRLAIKPPKFDQEFEAYVQEKKGEKYDFLKFLFFFVWWLLLKWNVAGRWITKLFTGNDKDVCSEFVARFYQNYIGVPCSGWDPDLSAPDDIYDFCQSMNFPVVYDSKNAM